MGVVMKGVPQGIGCCDQLGIANLRVLIERTAIDDTTAPQYGLRAQARDAKPQPAPQLEVFQYQRRRRPHRGLRAGSAIERPLGTGGTRCCPVSAWRRLIPGEKEQQLTPQP